MTGTATATLRTVDMWGTGTTHWYLDPPLDGHEYIVICDRGALMHEMCEFEAFDVTTVVTALVEVFPATSEGTLPDGAAMLTLTTPVSLRRSHDGVDVVEVLRGLGYAS